MNMVKVDELAKSEFGWERRFSAFASVMRYDAGITKADIRIDMNEPKNIANANGEKEEGDQNFETQICFR